MAISNANAAGREETCQPTFGAPPPADSLPFPFSQQRFGRDGRLIRDLVFAGPSSLRDGEDQSNLGGIDVLASRQTHRPPQTALAQSLTERPARAIPRIGKDTTETRARGDDAVLVVDDVDPDVLKRLGRVQRRRDRQQLAFLCALGDQADVRGEQVARRADVRRVAVVGRLAGVVAYSPSPS